MRRLVDALLFEAVQAIKKFRTRVWEFNAALGPSEFGWLAGCLHQGTVQRLASLAEAF